MMKRCTFGICFALVLIVFTGYVLLDTFVIARVYTMQGADIPAPQEVLPTAGPAAVTARSYEDANIRITLTEYREHDTTVYAADIRLSSPSLLKAVLANDSYGRNLTEKTSAMAERTGAILAINGDYYGSRESGYMARGGVLYRSTPDHDAEALAILKDGSFRIAAESSISAEALMDAGAVHIFSFGPALVENGQISVTTDDEVGKAMADNPRTAVGVYEPLHYVFIVSDGRTRESEGLTLHELAEFMQALGVTTAYNLDGGGSSTMVFMGEVVNTPTTNGRRITERSVSDIVCIGY